LTQNDRTLASEVSLTEGEYESQKAWVVDYYFECRNAFGKPIDFHVKVYFRNGERIGNTEPKSLLQKEWAKEEEDRKSRKPRKQTNWSNCAGNCAFDRFSKT
jgi:hypothetical protein